MNDEAANGGKKPTEEPNEDGRVHFQNGFEDDDNGIPMGGDDDFDIHLGGTAATIGPFFSQNGGEFALSQQITAMMGSEMPNARFDGDNLVEAPMQVNAINIEYAKTSKNIDVRRLKQVIWSLISVNDDKVFFLFNCIGFVDWP
jgi:hypothetical protein